MSKKNFFLKYLNNINNSINRHLEKNLNKLNFNNLRYLLINNKIILSFVALFVVLITYLLLPTFFNQTNISKHLKNELQKKLNLNFQFTQNLKYSFLPKPHFITNNMIIFDDQGDISKVDKFKIFVSIKNLFFSDNLKIKNLNLENANFNLNKENYNFFLNLLDKNFIDGSLTIKDSNIFFRNLDNEVLFVNKIIKLKYYYDSNELKNIIDANNEVFNIPYSIESFFNKEKSKFFSEVNFNSIKLKIENELNFGNEIKIGDAKFIFNNIKRFAKYEIKKNFFKFNIFDKIDDPNLNYTGKFNLRPFYASLEGDLEEINLNYLLSSNALIIQLLKTEIFNSKNIDFYLNINSNNIYNGFDFSNINLKSKIQEGLIDVDQTTFEWKDYADFELSESLIFVKNGELVLDGKLKIDVNDYDEIYRLILTPKNYRKEIKQIDLNFTYNFDQKIAQLKNIKIDNKINQDVNKNLNNVILKKYNIQNKIYFKNLLNDALKNYAG